VKILQTVILAAAIVLGCWLLGRSVESGAGRLAESVEKQGRYSFWSSEDGWMRIFDSLTGRVHVPSGGVWSELPLGGKLETTEKPSGLDEE
jgi:hypothetical protein